MMDVDSMEPLAATLVGAGLKPAQHPVGPKGGFETRPYSAGDPPEAASTCGTMWNVESQVAMSMFCAAAGRRGPR
jgi:hypothetical protein